MAKKAKKKAATCSWNRFGVMNHLGGIWSPRTFDNAQEAMDYIRAENQSWPSMDLRKHKIVPVRVTVTAREDR